MVLKQKECAYNYTLDDLYPHIVLGFVHNQNAHGLQWAKLIGVANKTLYYFVTFVGLTEQFEA